MSAASARVWSWVFLVAAVVAVFAFGNNVSGMGLLVIAFIHRATAIILDRLP